MELGRCIIKIEHNYKWKVYEFFLVPRNGEVLLGMPDMGTVYVSAINCNKIDMLRQREQIYSEVDSEHQCTNNTRETDKPDRYSINTTCIPYLNSLDNSVAIDNNNRKINCFIPGSQKEAEKRESAEITHQVYHFVILCFLEEGRYYV